jgi:hypothetical protein
MKIDREPLALRAWIAIVAATHLGLTVVGFLLAYEFRGEWSTYPVPLHVRAIDGLLYLLLLPLGMFAKGDADLLNVLGLFVFPLNSLLVGIVVGALLLRLHSRWRIQSLTTRGFVGRGTR